jgi:hypothetical protein
MRKAHAIGVVIAVLCGGALAGAQDVSFEQNKLLSKRAATADAYRKLAEAVYGLQINERTYVKDFVTESDDIRGEVDSFIKGIRLGTPTWYEDGSCEIPAEVTVSKVVETLRTAHDRYYKGEDIKTKDFESMAQRIDKQVIKVVGQGAPRPDLPDLPTGVAEIVGPPPVELAKLPIPEIWQQVGAQARLMALRAARVDALRKLAERIKGLRLTARTQVRDFMAASDEITAQMDTYLVGAEEVGTYLHNDELIAEVTLRVPTEQVITTIKSLYSRRFKDDEADDTRGHDIEDIIKTVVKRDFEATGEGVPPVQYLQKYNATAGGRLPEWSMSPVEAVGEGTDPAIETPQGKLRAARAAELDAKRKLAEQIAGLRLEPERTLADFAGQHEDVKALVDAVLVNAIVTRTEFTGNTARVTVSVPGMDVWAVVNGALQTCTLGIAAWACSLAG